jgi:cyclin E
MRAILIDWMMEVCCEFHLKRETFHLSVAYLDQYLSQAEPTLKAKLQLVGLAAMVIATKIEVPSFK